MNRNTITIKAKARDSNIELLRIIAMILVMVVHASFKSIGAPTLEDINSDSTGTFFRFLSESLSIICVNVFVLISGWFGIRAKIIRLSEFLFQVIFFGILMYVGLYALGKIDYMNWREWLNIFIFDGHWFVKSYIILYIFAPLLNSFIESCSKRQFTLFLIALFSLQTIYGFWVGSKWFDRGYSPLSFIGLYMLARYIKLYPNKFTTLNRCWDIILYLGFSLCLTLGSYFLVLTGYCKAWRLYQYSDPVVVIAAVYFFLYFTKITFKSKIINWIAVSSFAAYLVHCDIHFFQPYYLNTISHWFQTEGTISFFFSTAVFIFALFCISILLDKIRIVTWNTIVPIIKKTIP